MALASFVLMLLEVETKGVSRHNLRVRCISRTPGCALGGGDLKLWPRLRVVR
jgi:hypothetical protein